MMNSVIDKKTMVADAFARVAIGYQNIAYFPLLGQRLADLARIPAGAQVLDVASGRGAVLFPAAERVGSTGMVMGIDLSSGMVHETRAELTRRGLKKVHLRVMDAEDLDFPTASFDYVLCGFALHFFPRLDRALKEFRRVLRPGGWVAVSTWGAEDEHWDWYKDLLVTYKVDVKLSSHSFVQLESLEKLFDEVGFCNTKTLRQTFDWVLATPEEWWNAQWSISSRRVALETLDPSELDKLKAEVFRHLEAMQQPDGLHDLLRPQFLIAQKPTSEG